MILPESTWQRLDHDILAWLPIFVAYVLVLFKLGEWMEPTRIFGKGEIE
jgi:hypothetical protein